MKLKKIIISWIIEGLKNDTRWNWKTMIGKPEKITKKDKKKSPQKKEEKKPTHPSKFSKPGLTSKIHNL